MIEPGTAEPNRTDDGPVRIGVLGGTFDPPHFGHLAVALDVRHHLELHRLLLVVAHDPWQKSGHRGITPASERLAMTRAAVDGIDGLEVSDLEIRRGGETYTADTLAALGAEHPRSQLYLIVGSDAAAGLDTWKRPDEVRTLATTVVVERGGVSGARPPAGWDHVVVPVPALEISSSDLRERFAAGRPVAAMVPPAVVDVVHAAGLYGTNP